jgi:acyl-CoA thioesterase YciA
MELVTTKICMALDLGVHGNLFGGNMMSFLDEAAAAYACQICDSAKMVTKKIEEVVFESPVRVGNLIKIYASVHKFGTTSITINLEARKHNVHTGKQDLVCSNKMVFVKLDEEGSPIPISAYGGSVGLGSHRPCVVSEQSAGGDLRDFYYFHLADPDQHS